METYLYNMNHITDSQPSSCVSGVDGSDSEWDVQKLRNGIIAARQFFFNHQHPDGYWVAELEGDALLQSETIMLFAFLGEAETELAKECAQHLLDTQLPDGGWGMYTGGKSDINNTVKAYFALKLTGHDPGAEYMQKARVRALELGGVDKVNSFTRFYLAILGQIPHCACPAVPPQMMLLPNWFPINIYDMSAWSRTIFVPLSIVSALAPVRPLPPEKGIREIFVNPPEKWGPLIAPGKSKTNNPFSWDFFFRCCNSVMWFCRRVGFTPLRKKGIDKALQWTLEHCEKSNGPGAIYPPIIWAWIAFKALGYNDDSKEVRYCREELEKLIIRNEAKGTARVQPCKSPVWDTSLTLKSLMIGGLTTSHPAVRKGVQWVRSRHIKEPGDWMMRRREGKKNSVSSTIKKPTAKIAKYPQLPNGWCFEFDNVFYPDCDDTAMALMVLAGRFDEAGTGQLPPDLRITAVETVESIDEAKQSALDTLETNAVVQSGLRWLFGMQNKDGGWAAFDRDNTKEFLCKVPFADHNAMIDPSTPDLTGRVMESLGRLGFRVGQQPEIDRVVAYMRKQQQADGSWFGRWGVNYIYGTWQALTGLTAVGVPADDPAVQVGANWLLAHQHSSGGWGESPDSYEEPALRGSGTPTASQTAWAVMGLIAADKTNDPAVKCGIRFLLDRQRQDGTWFEPEYTGTGFPLVFYLKYHYYSVYFPLMALSLYAAKQRVTKLEITEEEAVLPMHRLRIFSPETECYNNSRPDDPQPTMPEHRNRNREIAEKESTHVTLRLFLG